MIAILAFGLSYVASSFVSQGISDLIFHRVAESQEAPEIEVPDDGSEYLDITGQYIPYDTSELETVESVRVNVRPSDLHIDKINVKIPTLTKTHPTISQIISFCIAVKDEATAS